MKFDFFQNKFVETEIMPDKLAIAGSDIDINWSTLGAIVEKLSVIFNELKIPQGHPIIIYGHKESFFPSSILACYYTGITYIPIDKIYPINRIEKIIEQTNSQILINCTDSDVEINIPVIINFEFKIKKKQIPNYSNSVYGTIEEPLQYIMFTSGSTGEPKGVQITKKSVLSFVTWALNDFGFTPEDVFLNQAPFSFDVSLCDIINAFSQGATLVLNSNEIVKNQDALISRIENYKCSIWTSTPSFAFLFLRHSDFNAIKLKSLRMFLFMGEVLPHRTCTILKSNFKNVKIVNAYGPTEATIVTTWIEITDEILQKFKLLPIGYPSPESEIIVEKSSSESKDGELIIVGEHVSIGYFKDFEHNKEKFFIHNGKRAFRTGDIAYFEDNLIFFLGRNDEQIKLHGYRIELGEISNEIFKNKNVVDVVTIPLRRNNEIKKIVSFIKINESQNYGEIKKQLYNQLEKTLPYYMIPNEIILLNEFPYSSSHKIDKNKLIENYINSM